VSWSVEVNEAADQAIRTLAPNAADGRETGGILLGRGPDHTGAIRVEQAGDAGPKAIRRPNFFLRDLKHARALADEAWERDGAVWIGEWHTHLEGSGDPSDADLDTYVRLLATADLQFDVFVSIISTPGEADGWDSPDLWPWVLELGHH